MYQELEASMEETQAEVTLAEFIKIRILSCKKQTLCPFLCEGIVVGVSRCDAVSSRGTAL